jgi:hypothetical protein
MLKIPKKQMERGKVTHVIKKDYIWVKNFLKVEN